MCYSTIRMKSYHEIMTPSGLPHPYPVQAPTSRTDYSSGKCGVCGALVYILIVCHIIRRPLNIPIHCLQEVLRSNNVLFGRPQQTDLYVWSEVRSRRFRETEQNVLQTTSMGYYPSMLDPRRVITDISTKHQVKCMKKNY